MRILLLGASGQIGTELRGTLPRLGELVAATRSGLLDGGQADERIDINEHDALAAILDKLRPDVVVNAAAYTAVELAEKKAELAHMTNAQSVAVLARECCRLNALLVHYSTDYVFSGVESNPYKEIHLTSPINVYGASKAAGDRAIEESGARHLILRAGWVYGAVGRNFLTTIVRAATEQNAIRVVDDQIGTPTPARVVAEITTKMLSQGLKSASLYNVAPSGATSWYGFAEAIVDGALRHGLLAKRPSLIPIKSEEFAGIVQRPAQSVLDPARLAQDYGIRLGHWRILLNDVLAEMAELRSVGEGV